MRGLHRLANDRAQLRAARLHRSTDGPGDPAARAVELTRDVVAGAPEWDLVKALRTMSSTMAQLAEWPAVVTYVRTVDEARTMLADGAREMIASYRAEGREPPIGAG